MSQSCADAGSVRSVQGVSHRVIGLPIGIGGFSRQACSQQRRHGAGLSGTASFVIAPSRSIGQTACSQPCSPRNRCRKSAQSLPNRWRSGVCPVRRAPGAEGNCQSKRPHDFQPRKDLRPRDRPDCAVELLGHGKNPPQKRCFWTNRSPALYEPRPAMQAGTGNDEARMTNDEGSKPEILSSNSDFGFRISDFLRHSSFPLSLPRSASSRSSGSIGRPCFSSSHRPRSISRQRSQQNGSLGLFSAWNSRSQIGQRRVDITIVASGQWLVASG